MSSTLRAAALLTMCSISVNLASAAQPKEVKNGKLARVSAKAAQALDKAVKVNLLEDDRTKIMLRNLTVPGKESWTMDITGGALGKSFELPGKTALGLVLQTAKAGGVTIAKIIFRTKLIVTLAEVMEIDEVEVAKGTRLERTTDGNWWVDSDELRERQLLREKAERAAEADKKKQAAAAPDDEKAAALKLKNVRELIAAGNTALAKIRCQAIIDTHGRTRSAEEARQLLAKLTRK